MVHLHNGILLSHKKKEILPFATTWINLENIMLSKLSESEKDKYCMISIMWNLMNKINTQQKNCEYVEGNMLRK